MVRHPNLNRIRVTSYILPLQMSMEKLGIGAEAGIEALGI